MTKKEAKKALLQGKKVRHKYYLDNNYLKLSEGYLINQKGENKGDFSGIFWGRYFDNCESWSIVEDKTDDSIIENL